MDKYTRFPRPVGSTATAASSASIQGTRRQAQANHAEAFAVLWRVLRDFPDARESVVAALRGIDDADTAAAGTDLGVP